MKKYTKIIIRGIRGIFYYLIFVPKLCVKKILLNKQDKIKIIAGTQEYQMFINREDKGLSNQLITCGTREHPNVEYLELFIRKKINNIDYIIDIGANIGFYSLFMNDITAHRNIQIIAIEPVLGSYKILKLNSSLSKNKQIKTFNYAIGESEKKVIISVPDSKNLSHIKNAVKTTSSAKNIIENEVEMITLSKLLSNQNIKPKRILFRFDIEGYEYNLLKGNIELFKSINNAYMIFEYHPYLLSEKENYHFMRLIKEAGFKLHSVISCYPLYFLTVPKYIQKILIKLWVLEKNNDPLGLMERYKSIEDLEENLANKESSLYTHPNVHLYLIKEKVE